MKVIVADGNEVSRTMLINTLKRQDHEPIVLDSAQNVLDAYEKDDEINILFLDWNLPGTDGLEIATKIRYLNFHMNRDCYIIITGEKGGRYDIMNAMEMGANDLITKPYDSNIVADRMKTAIDHFLELPDEVEKTEKDPVEHLMDEHGILRFQADKLEDLLDSVDEEAPSKLINWMGGRIFVFETKVHQDKEHEFSVAFMERLMNAHGEENQALSESSSQWVESEHNKLDTIVSEVKDRFKSYKESLDTPQELPENYNILKHVNDYPAFCLKCQNKVVMLEPSIFQLETGNYAFKGKCPDCNGGVTSIIGKSIGAIMKHAALKRSLKKYLNILKDHLKREEDLYFPLANRYLTSGDKTRLLEEFKKIEDEFGIHRMGKDFLLSPSN